MMSTCLLACEGLGTAQVRKTMEGWEGCDWVHTFTLMSIGPTRRGTVVVG